MTGTKNYFLSVVEEICGPEGVDLIVKHFGGLEISIPAIPKAHHRLCQVLGREHVERIVHVFGFGRVDVPLDIEGAPNRRRRIAAEMMSAGASVSKVAKALGVSLRTAQRYSSAIRRTNSAS